MRPWACRPGRVFKTLIADVDEQLTVAVVQVAGSLDLKALASAVSGKRARMADPPVGERATGYVTGGISSVGQRRPLPVVVDATALNFGTIFCSAGQREIEIAPGDLVRAAGAASCEAGDSPTLLSSLVSGNQGGACGAAARRQRWALPVSGPPGARRPHQQGA